MPEPEVFERIVAAYQTYESVGGRAEYRTALVWRQPDGGGIDGVSGPFAVLTVVAESATGTVGTFSGHETEEAARAAAQAWLGSDRQVALEKVPHGALNWLVQAVTGHIYR
jgi:hypothetical protein